MLWLVLQLLPSNFSVSCLLCRVFYRRPRPCHAAISPSSCSRGLMRRGHDISSTKLIGQGSAKCLSSFFCKQHFMRIGKYTTVPGILVRYVSLGAPALIKASKQGHGDGGQQWQVQHSSTENAANKGLSRASASSIFAKGCCCCCCCLLSLKCSTLSPVPSPRLVSLLALKTREQTFAE